MSIFFCKVFAPRYLLLPLPPDHYKSCCSGLAALAATLCAFKRRLFELPIFANRLEAVLKLDVVGETLSLAYLWSGGVRFASGLLSLILLWSLPTDI
jgi:hypothetical protein